MYEQQVKSIYGNSRQLMLVYSCILVRRNCYNRYIYAYLYFTHRKLLYNINI